MNLHNTTDLNDTANNTDAVPVMTHAMSIGAAKHA